MAVDSLQIEISASASSAASALKTLEDSLSRLQGAVNSLSFGAISKIGTACTAGRKSIDALHKALSNLNTASGDVNFDPMNSALQKAGTEGSAALQKINEQLDKMSGSATDAASNISKIGKAANSQNSVNVNVSTSAKNAKHTLKELADNIKAVDVVIIGGLRQIGKFVAESNDYVESLNLFNASLGQYANQAQQYAQQVSNILGIDISDWQRNQGIFMTLGDGFGVASDRAYVMSQQLTQLGYDLSSFFNLDVGDAMQKLQSGFSGELEPLRRLGFDLSETRLKAEAAALGITKSFNAMTQAEKAQLRYHAIMTQVTVAQGDMARTLDSPANALRVLKSQVTMAAREIGNVFIPMLNAIIPIATAVVRAVRNVAAAIASLFGFNLSTVDYSSDVSAAADAAEQLDSNLGSAGGSAKKLKSYLMGFDELNVIDPDSGSGGGGGGSAGSGDGWTDFDLSTYDFLGGLVESKFESVYNSIKGVVDYITEHIDTILPIVTSIGSAILAWKIAAPFKDGMQKIAAVVSRVFAVASIGVIDIALNWIFLTSFSNGGSWGNLLGSAITTGASGWAIGKVLANMIGAKFVAAGGGKITMGISAIVTAAISLITSFNAVKEGGVTGNTILTDVYGVAAAALGGALIASAIGAGAAAGAGVAVAIALPLAVTLTIIGVEINKEKERQKAFWGTAELSASEIQTRAQQLFTFDVDARIDLINTTVTNAESATDDLNRKVEEVQTAITPIRIGAEVTPDTYQELYDSIIGENGLISSTQKKLTQNANVIQMGATLGLVDSDGNDVSAEYMNSITTGNTIVTSAITSFGNELAKLLEEGIKGQLDADKQKRVQELTQYISDIAVATARGAATAQADISLAPALSDLEEGSFTGITSKYGEYADTLQQKNRQLAESVKVSLGSTAYGLEATAKALEKEGASAEEIQAAWDAANDAKAKYEAYNVETTAAAWTTEDTAHAREQIADAMRTNTSKMFGDGSQFDLNTDWIVAASAPTQFGEDYTKYNKDYLASYRDGLSLMIEQIVGSDNYTEMVSTADLIGLKDWDLLGTEIQQGLFDSVASVFGSDSAIQMFKDLGYDLTNLVTDGTVQAAAEGALSVDDLLDAALSTDGKSLVDILKDCIEVGSDNSMELSDVIDISGWDELGNEGRTQILDAISQLPADEKAQYEQLLKDMGYDIATALPEGIAEGMASGNDDSGNNAGVEYFNEVDTAADSTRGKFSLFASAAAESMEDFALAADENGDKAVKSLGNNVQEILTEFGAKKFEETGRSAAMSLSSGLHTVVIPDLETGVKLVKRNWTSVGDWVSSQMGSDPVVSVKGKITKLETAPGASLSLRAKFGSDKITLTPMASGGFLSTGEIFVAREAGPELVGKIGHRSAVANNDQIVEAVSSGVYSALVQEMSQTDNSSEGGNITITLDGKTIYENQQGIKRNRGYNLGMGAFSFG